MYHVLWGATCTRSFTVNSKNKHLNQVRRYVQFWWNFGLKHCLMVQLECHVLTHRTISTFLVTDASHRATHQRWQNGSWWVSLSSPGYKSVLCNIQTQSLPFNSHFSAMIENQLPLLEQTVQQTILFSLEQWKHAILFFPVSSVTRRKCKRLHFFQRVFETYFQMFK